jgi:hypothetical protein
MECKATQKTEAIQNSGPGGILADKLIVNLLIEVTSGFMAGRKVDLKVRLMSSKTGFLPEPPQ